MKKTLITQSIGLAALASQTPEAIAVLNAEHEINANDTLVQILPAGEFNAVDGRPFDVVAGHWLLDQQAFEALKANTPHQTGDLVIDYEHQTRNADQNGQPAIAAGFFNIKDVHFMPGKGLFIQPRWTDKAKAHLKAGEYKYISAVFGYDKITGRPQFLHSAGLVNRPGVDGMQPLAELAAKNTPFITVPTNTFTTDNLPGENTVKNKLLLALLAGLGIDADENALAEPTALKAIESKVTVALAALKSQEAEVTTLNQTIVALKADGGEKYDPSKHMPVEIGTQMQTELAQLKAQVNGNNVDELVKQGVADGRILPAMEPWARELGNHNIAQLSAYLDKAAPIAALKGKQTADEQEHGDNNIAALSADDKYAAEQLGISHDEFAKQKGAK